jgi:hypothetical protein
MDQAETGKALEMRALVFQKDRGERRGLSPMNHAV